MKPSQAFSTIPALAVAIVLATFSGWSAPAVAQSLKPAVIAVIDSRRLLSESKVSVDIRQQLIQVSQKIESERTGEQDALMKDKDKLDGQRGLLVQEEFERQYSDLKRRADQLNRQADINQKQMNVAQMRANRELQKVLSPIISQVAAKKGATVVLEQSQIVYQVDGLDITPEVVDLLDKQLPSLKIQVPTEAEIIEMEKQANQGQQQ